MPDYIYSTNMSLTVPITGVTLGPNWANEISACFVVLDAHDHTQGKGVAITPDGLNINADLSLQSNNLTLIRTLRLEAPNVQPALSTDLNCLYAFGSDLYYRDGAGNQVRITQLGSVAGATGNITNLASPASVTYVSGTTTFVFQSDATVAANLDAGSLILRNLSASSYGLTLSPPAGLAADLTITLPLKPAATAVMTMNSSGAMSTTVPDGTTIINSASVLRVGTVQEANCPSGFGFTPAGAITAFGGSSAPTGYLLCDGSSYLRSSYANLFAAIGTAFGAADGTHFNVPDARGYFLRGVSGTTSNDPDKLTRTAMATGGNTGNDVGSVQADAFRAHTHTVDKYDDGATNGAALKDNATTFPNGTVTSNSTGGTETRPLNFYVNYIIKT